MNDHTEITNQPKVPHDNNVSEDGTLKYDFMISLKNIALAKMSINLWMNQHTQDALVNLFHENIETQKISFEDELQQIRRDVVSKVSELFLPVTIADKLRKIVRLTGESIIDWIKYNDYFVFNTSKCSKYSAVDEIVNIMWTTRGKIDHARTAKNILANQDNYLSDDQKYKLACTNCLEEEIALIAPNVVNPHYLKNVAIDIYPMVYFWTAHITGDDTGLYNPVYHRTYDRFHSDNMSKNLFIVMLIMCSWEEKSSCKEISIKYMLNKISAAEITKYLDVLLFLVPKTGDLRYSLLSSLDYEQQKAVFEKHSWVVLSGTLRDWLWIEHFIPTALHVLGFMGPFDYSLVWHNIIYELFQARRKDSQVKSEYIFNEYKCLFKWLWKKGSKYVNDDSVVWFVEVLLKNSLSWELGIDIIEVIFNDLNTQHKKNIIFGCHGINRCVHIIKNSQWDLLELFISYALSSEKDINQLKQKLISSRGYEIVEHFVQQKALDKIEDFVHWALLSEEEIRRFKQNIVCVKFHKLSESLLANIRLSV